MGSRKKKREARGEKETEKCLVSGVLDTMFNLYLIEHLLPEALTSVCV